MIKAILFDLDDTLLWDERSVQEAFKATCEKAEERYEVDVNQLELAVRHAARELYSSLETFPFTSMIGINPFEAFWGNFNDNHHEQFNKLKQLVPAYRIAAWTKGLQKLGINDAEFGKELAEIFPVERRKRPFIYEETLEVLEQLKGNYKLLLLTNGSPDLQQEKLAGVPALAPYFDHIIISGAFGRGKPDVTIFEHALQLLSVPSHEAIMVGDKLTTDILGANRANLKSVWLNRHRISQANDSSPDYEIDNLQQLISILQKA